MGAGRDSTIFPPSNLRFSFQVRGLASGCAREEISTSMDEKNEVMSLYEAAIQGNLSRRTMMKRAMALGLSASVTASLLAACGSDDDEADTGEPTESGTGTGGTTPEATEDDAEPTTAEGEDDESTEEPAGEGVRGGTLRIAMIGEPATFDIHQTTGTIVALIGWNIYEPLVAFDSNFEVIPMLADSIETSDDGLTNTINLRQGVPFHNGEEMKAADVIASIERWGQLSGVGKGLMERTEEIVEVDDYTIEFKMSEPYSIFVTALAFNNQGCAIYPKSVIDKVGPRPATGRDHRHRALQVRRASGGPLHPAGALRGVRRA